MNSMPLCLFTGRVERRDGNYVFTIPEQELELGTLEAEETYRVGVYSGSSAPPKTTQQSSAVHQPRSPRPTSEEPSPGAVRESSRPGAADTDSSGDAQSNQPPVTEGETLQVQIEELGDKGDGIARVGPGYIVFVSETEVGQQPRVTITSVRENFAFAEVLDE